ncbi:MAG: gpW family head-tail joining protein [Acetobacteraceae bacterium]
MSDQVTVLPPWTAGVSITPAVLTGVDPALLRQWLSEAQTAYQQMMVSNNPQTVTYGQGDGQKSVTFSRSTNPGQLAAWIQQLQQALGLSGGRRPIAVRFGR